jgi:hypothetical protein
MTFRVSEDRTRGPLETWIIEYPFESGTDCHERINDLKTFRDKNLYPLQQQNIEAAIAYYEQGVLPDKRDPMVLIQDGRITSLSTADLTT